MPSTTLLTRRQRHALLAAAGRPVIAAAELWSRAAHATRTELAADRFTDDERDEITAEIVARTLAAVAQETSPPKIDRRRRRVVGSTPYRRALAAEHAADVDKLPPPALLGVARADSPRVDFIRLCRLAATEREKLERRHARTADLAAAAAIAAPMAAEVDWTGARDPADVQRIAADFAERLDLDPERAPHRVLAWHFARDLPDAHTDARRTLDLSPAQVAAELDLTPGAYRQNLARAQAELRRLYPDPADLLARIVGHRAVARIDPDAIPRSERAAARAALARGESVPMVLDFNLPGQPWPTFPLYVVSARGELDSHPHRVGHDWREGTGPDGERVKRPADRAAAIARCRIIARGDRRKRSRPSADARARTRASARRKLAAAYRADALHRDGSRKLRTVARDPRTL